MQESAKRGWPRRPLHTAVRDGVGKREFVGSGEGRQTLLKMSGRSPRWFARLAISHSATTQATGEREQVFSRDGSFSRRSSVLCSSACLRSVMSRAILDAPTTFPLGIPDRRYRHRDVDQASILAPADCFKRLDAFAANNAFDDRPFFHRTGRPEIRMVIGLPKHFFFPPGTPEEPFRAVVPARDDAIEVLGHDGVVGGIHDRGQLKRLLSRRRLSSETSTSVFSPPINATAFRSPAKVMDKAGTARACRRWRSATASMPRFRPFISWSARAIGH